MGPNFKRSLARAAAISRMKNASHSDRQNLPTCVSDMAKVSAAIHNQQFPREWESRARYQVLQSLPDPVISEFIFYVTRTPPHTNEEPNWGTDKDNLTWPMVLTLWTRDDNSQLFFCFLGKATNENSAISKSNNFLTFHLWIDKNIM